jgi:gamma-glutamylcysteine synthetase
VDGIRHRVADVMNVHRLLVDDEDDQSLNFLDVNQVWKIVMDVKSLNADDLRRGLVAENLVNVVVDQSDQGYFYFPFCIPF